MVVRHVFDALSIHDYIHGTTCLDVGSGAGIPGLILALVQPDKSWTLLDSSQKRVRFLRHVKASLKIENVNIVQARVEDYQHSTGYTTIVCRALSSLSEFVRLSRHLLADGGRMLAMKAAIDEKELSEVDDLVSKLELVKLKTVDTDSRRCLVVITG